MPEWEPTLRETSAPGPHEPVPLLRLGLNETGDGEITDQRDPERKITVAGKVSRVPGKLDSAIRLDGTTHLNLGDVASFERTDRFSIGAWINYDKLEKREASTIIARIDS